MVRLNPLWLSLSNLFIYLFLTNLSRQNLPQSLKFLRPCVVHNFQAFPRNSNLTSYFSRAILNVTQGEEMDRIEQKYFGSISDDHYQDQSDTSYDTPSLTTHSFAGLFMITGFFTLLALLASESHIWKKPVMLAKTCSQKFLFSLRSIKSSQTLNDYIPRAHIGSTDEANKSHPENSSTASTCQSHETLPM